MEELGPLFVHPHEASRIWILVVIAATPCIAAALYALVRTRLPDPVATSGMLLLPIVAYVLGDLSLMEQSKKVTFCGSCHETMSPIVKSLSTDKEALSSRHFQLGAVSYVDACYECHSGYGMWGTVHAKLAGVRHMLHTVTENYEFPLSLNAPFDISSCLACHAEAVPFRAVELHRDESIQKALLSGEMGCTGACHPPAHPETALNGVDSVGKVAAK